MQTFMKSKKFRVARILALVLPLCCLMAFAVRTVLAQNTYVITDGESVTVHNSFASDPEKVLDEAGVELSADDFYTTEQSGGVSEITVQRAQKISIDYCGKKMQASSHGERLDAMLGRLGIQAYGSYSVSQPLDSMTYDGMQVRISNIVETVETYTVEIPYETIFCNDPSLPAGQEEVLVEGRSGQMLCSANVCYVNTQEQSRTVMQETVLEAPVDRIVAMGTGVETETQEERGLLIGDGVIVLPTGEVLTYTESDTYKATAYTHMDAGCDTVTATGTKVHWGTVAVDPRQIPYGTRMFIVTADGSYIYGLATAEDCGGGVKGKHVDLYMPTLSQAFDFGIRQCTIYFLGESDW